MEPVVAWLRRGRRDPLPLILGGKDPDREPMRALSFLVAAALRSQPEELLAPMRALFADWTPGSTRPALQLLATALAQGTAPAVGTLERAADELALGLRGLVGGDDVR